MLARTDAATLSLEGKDGIALVGDLRGGNRPTVLFLHGGGQSRLAWRGSSEALAARGFGSLALDLRGHGDSGWSPEGDYRLDAYVEDLAIIVANFGAPVVLVGASLGGLVALKFAARHRELTKGIVLVDVTPRHSAKGGDRIKLFLRSGAAGFASIEEASDDLSSLMGTTRRKETDGLRPYLNERADGRFYWKWDPRFIDDEHLGGAAEDDSVIAAARSISAPALLIRAENSDVVRQEDVEHFLALMPTARFVEIAATRHMVTGDSNSIYSDVISDFVADLDKDGRGPATVARES